LDLDELIRRLCAASGPSGSEEGARDTAAELLRPFVDELQTDALGNLIAIRRCGLKGAPRILLDAHLDEVGLIVTGCERGFLRFASLGGVDARMLPAREVVVLTDEPMRGVIDTLPVHILSAEEMEKAIEPEKLRIDVGLSAEACDARVPPGTPVVFAGGCEKLSGDVFSGKALDDRACVAILIRVMERLKDTPLRADICCLLAAQEELGMRGAAVGAFSAEPALAIALDATHARTPDAKKGETLPMGQGAAIGVGPNMNRRVTEELIALAKDKGIPYQIEVLRGNSGTDAWPIQVSRSGIPTALVSLPVKYMHSPVETMSLRDAESMTALVTAYIEQYGKGGEERV
jgi:putative aminopeptidase FrvX